MTKYKNEKSIKVGIFTHDFYPFIGGMGRHIHEIYTQNEKYNKLNLHFYSPNKNNLKNHTTIFPETKSSKLKNIDFSIKLNLNINKIIQKDKLDLVHLQGGPGGLFLFSKPSVPVVYTCYHTYWQQSHYIESQKWKRVFYYLEKLSYKNTDRIICISKDTLDVVESHYGIKSKKLLHIPCGIDLQENTPPKTPLLNKTSSGLLYVGRIEKRKGIDFLVKAMRLVNKKNPGIKLIIVGEGADRQMLEKYSKENSLNIEFLGKISDEKLAEVYKEIKIQVVPSVFEGFGLTVLEGMSRNVPVLATKVDGVKTIISNGYNGILIDYGDQEALAQGITKLVKDENLQRKIVLNGRKTLKQYDIHIVYMQYANFFNSLKL